MPVNATPNIQHDQSGISEGGGMHSYFKKSQQVRLGGRVGEGSGDGSTSMEKSDLPILANTATSTLLPGPGQIHRLGTVVGVIIHHDLSRSRSHIAGREGHCDRATGYGRPGA